jgi:hypothetical protein
MAWPKLGFEVKFMSDGGAGLFQLPASPRSRRDGSMLRVLEIKNLDGQTDDAVRRFQGRMRALDSYAPSVREGWFDARLVSPVARIGILDRTGTSLQC